MTATEAELVGLAIALGARSLGPLSEREISIARNAARVPDARVAHARAQILGGRDPLGDAFCALRSPQTRRAMGATYTPDAIIQAMTAWGREARPARIVDPGAGSGRFAVAAARAMPEARVVAVELDPVAALTARAHLFIAGIGDRATVLCDDYRRVSFPRIRERTLFLGNPPYVRHHGIAPAWKRWLSSRARRLGAPSSQLAGLHVHFFLATAFAAREGDVGALLTSSEWLDVNYGALARTLFAGPLGLVGLDVVDPAALPFPDADTTAAIATFEVGSRAPTISVRQVSSVQALAPLAGGRPVARETLQKASRWSPLLRPAPRRPAGLIELGELCRVHRGQVTGSNAVWVVGPHDTELPSALLFPSVTRARELFAAGSRLEATGALRRVVDLPVDLDALDAEARRAVEAFLRRARRQGAHATFVARSRRAWWSVGLRAPAPILATYMARRPPAFVRNVAGARHINVAHGLYPRAPMSEAALDHLATYLASETRTADGRTYAGGLTKFEPREMERLLVPDPG
jgi:SAM-dependent methyltransferase